MASADTGPSYYAVLNVPKDASEDDIKRAHKLAAATYHPDKHRAVQLEGSATSSFELLQEAYEVPWHTRCSVPRHRRCSVPRHAWEPHMLELFRY